MNLLILFIRMGKQKLDDSDSDDSDDEDSDEEKESEKSIVLNNGNNSDSSKDGDGSSGSITGVKQDGELSGGSSSESGSEEEREIFEQGNKESSEVPNVDSLNYASEPVNHDDKIAEVATVPCSELTVASETEVIQDEKTNNSDPVVENVSTSSCGDGDDSTLLTSESRSTESEPGVHKEACSSSKVEETEAPLDFDQINSAAELEVCLRIYPVCLLVNLSYVISF